MTPYCYACRSEEVTAWIETPLGCVFGCAEHAEVLPGFWLLPQIHFNAETAGNQARQHDGGTGKNGGPGIALKVNAVAAGR